MSTLKVDTVEDLSAGESIDATYLVHGVVTARVFYNASATLAVNESVNVSSVTDNGTGDHTANFTNNMSSATHSSSGHAQTTAHSEIAATAVSSLNVMWRNTSNTLVDLSWHTVSVVGPLA